MTSIKPGTRRRARRHMDNAQALKHGYTENQLKLQQDAAYN